jgi:hypothetical protein
MPKLRLFIVSIWAEHALSACGVLAIRANCVVPEQTMTEYPYILFNKSPEQMRILGARGGKAYGRNRRTRRALLADTPPPAVPTRAQPQETAARAIHSLDRQFPWLRGAEKQPGGSRRAACARTN